MSIPVYFATNRNKIESPVPNNFGTDFNVDGALVFGRAVLKSVADESELGNSNLSIDALSPDDFSPTLRQAIVGQGADHLLIYLHGFDYRFRETVMRAGFLSDWYRRGKPSVASTIIAFSWPSLGSLNLDAYRTDYRNAAASAGAFRRFLTRLLPLLQEYRAAKATRRVSLMAHSMGNHFLHAGLTAAIGTAPGQFATASFAGLIDQLFLVASDEDADALSSPGGLRWTPDIAGHVALYYNNQDIPLKTISRPIHGVGRLGVDGPADKPSFRTRNISFINCSAANPELKPRSRQANPPRLDPQWHQYYRLVPEVRNDICGVMLGRDGAGLPNRTYRRTENFYRLDLAK
nr:alpha/beta hydrolase [uncultured Dongia sp.]